MTTATVTQIAKALGKSRVAINNKAKKWTKANPTGVARYDIESIGLTRAEQVKVKRLLGIKPEAVGENLPVASVIAPPAVIAPLPALTELTGRQNTFINSRLCLVQAVKAEMALGQRWQQAIDYVAEQIALGVQPFAGQAALANDRPRKGKPLSARSIARFYCDYKNAGDNPAALAPNDGDIKRIARDTALIEFARDFGTRADTGVLPAGVPAWFPYFLAEYRKPQKPSISDAIRGMRRRMPDDIEMPTPYQVRGIAKKLPAVYAEKGRKTSAELKAIMGFNRRVWKDYDPFTVGQIDGHSFKAYVAHPVTGAHFHPEVCGLICNTTKILAGYSAGFAESARTVADAARHAATVNENKPVGGVFTIVEPDMGAGNKAIVNADKEIGVFARIGTTLSFPDVAGNPQGHGCIERSNQSIWIRAAKELPTYTGKDMDRSVRKKVYNRLEKDLTTAKNAGELGKVEKTSKLLLSWKEFLAALEIWVAEYNNTPHRALPKITDPVTGYRRHRTPYEELAHRINEGWDPQSCQVDQNLLNYLFMPHQRIKVNRCEFRLHGNRYHSYALQTHHGEEMIAAYDIHNADKVWVLDKDERLICEALWNGNDLHGVPTTKLEQALYERIQGQKKLKMRQIDMIEHTRGSAVPTEHTEEVKRQITLVKQQIEEDELKSASVFELPRDARDKQYCWQAIDTRIQAGEQVSAEETNFHRGWQGSNYFKAWQAIHQPMCKEG